VEQITTRNLALVGVDKEKHLLLIRGTVPGANGGVVFVRQAKTWMPAAAEVKA
jgi:large subunit ribosomal protein L3